MSRTSVCASIAVVLALAAPGRATEPGGSEVIGEAFGRPVTAAEFEDCEKTVRWLSRGGQRDRSDEEIRRQAWDHLVYLQEAKRLGLQVKPEDVEVELTPLMKGLGVTSPDRYAAWTSSTLHESLDAFKRRIEELLLVEKLKEFKADLEVTVSEEEIRQKFLNEQNQIETEYIVFASQDEAESFAELLKQEPFLWKPAYDGNRKEGQRRAAWINFMTLEAYIELWKVPREDAYRTLEAGEGAFVPGRLTYGDVVFRVLQVRHAKLEDLETRRDYYTQAAQQRKKYQVQQTYLEDLKARARVRDYRQPLEAAP